MKTHGDELQFRLGILSVLGRARGTQRNHRDNAISQLETGVKAIDVMDQAIISRNDCGTIKCYQDLAKEV